MLNIQTPFIHQANITKYNILPKIDIL